MALPGDTTKELHWLAVVCGEIRERHGTTQDTIGHYAGLSRESVRKFEAGITRPTDMEGVAAIYAAIEGLLSPDGSPDGRQIFKRALARWEESGEDGLPALPLPRVMPPLAGGELPQPPGELSRHERSASPKRKRPRRRANG